MFLAPISLFVLVPCAASVDGLFALFAFETLIYVVGTAFVVVVMAKERVALVHKTAAMTDLLTGLFNRRAFLEAADRLIAQHARKSLPVSVMLFDLDKFKSINDRFGHAAGDDALKVFAGAVSTNMRGDRRHRPARRRGVRSDHSGQCRGGRAWWPTACGWRSRPLAS